MVRLLIGSLSNGLVVLGGYLLIGFLAVSYIRSTESDAIGTEEFTTWLNVVTFAAMAFVALGAAYLNVRLAQRDIVRPLIVAVVAVAVPVLVVSLLNIDYLQGYEESQDTAYLFLAVAGGAIIGSALASGVISAIRNRGR